MPDVDPEFLKVPPELLFPLRELYVGWVLRLFPLGTVVTLLRLEVADELETLVPDTPALDLEKYSFWVRL